MNHVMRNLLAGLALSALLAGCTPRDGEVRPDDADAAADAAAGTAGAPGGDVGAATGVAPAASAAPVDPLDDPASPLARRLVYFDFDRSDIKPEYLDVLASHAKYLVEHPSVRVRLEGHCDERGSREYNIGLGDRRAQAVRRILLFQGVSAAQLTTVSYGEERPAVDGHDEAAWTRNRRVELVYLR